MTLLNEIKSCIESAIQDAYIEVSDPRQDGAHLEAIVVSDQFENMSLLQQHRTVMNLLKERFETSLHALKLETYTHQTWNQRKEGPL